MHIILYILLTLYLMIGSAWSMWWELNVSNLNARMRIRIFRTIPTSILFWPIERYHYRDRWESDYWDSGHLNKK